MVSCATSKKVVVPESGNGFYVARYLVEQGPEGVKKLLEMTKKGSSDGDTEIFVAAGLIFAKCDVYPLLLPYFSDKKPEVRAFAALVAGLTGDKRYTPHIKALLNDKTEINYFFGEYTVADRAKSSLEHLKQGGFTQEDRDLLCNLQECGKRHAEGKKKKQK